jgi:protocatechuate 3,4-dioxygenase alpha subunit
LTPTAWQTVGPFFHHGLAWPGDPVRGEALVLAGRILDADGRPVADALVETLLRGRLARAATDDLGAFALRVAAPAERLVLVLMMRGLLSRLVTCVRLAPGPDPLVEAAPPARRATLLATPGGPGRWTHTIRLQGPDETVFFDV